MITSDLKAMTFWRPWDHAVLYGGKQIENRPWAPPKNLIGQIYSLFITDNF